ncbi:glycosyltransferase [Rhodococcus qingshengii]|nr:glycosyltransferase [Rhodococcus qingshengii]
MKIMVFDVPAESGGALSVLIDYYNECKENTNKNYIFVVSKANLKETKNIKVLRYPWIKKSWAHRLFFDNFIAPNLIRKFEVDEVLSLQNIIIPHTNIHQVVYVHNALPFVDYRFSFFENRFLWIHQNILGRKIFKSIIKANKVIVQTEWMRNICVNKLKINEEKISVMPPKIKGEINGQFNVTKSSLSTFFYPASSVEFKNHKVIIDACLILLQKGIVDYKVYFTLKGDENDSIKELYKKANDYNLPIVFLGNITREKVFNTYTKSILVFPSYIESSPLPLSEARLHNTPIIASDCSFSHEILDGYKFVDFFNPFDANHLSELLNLAITGNIVKK